MAGAVQAGCPRCGKSLQVRKGNHSRIRCAHCGATVRISHRDRASTSTKKIIDGTPPVTFAFDETAAGPIIQIDRPSRRRFWIRLAATTAFLCTAAGLIYWKWGDLNPYWERYLAVVRESGPVVAVPPQVQPRTPAIAVSHVAEEATQPFPRRLLAISVNNYLYANPLENGVREASGQEPTRNPGAHNRSIDSVVTKLGNALRIHESQITVLSDGSHDESATAPLKPVIEDTVTAFLGACRRQDRVIVLFAGHAAEIGEVPYLVPIEGEFKTKETLIPLQWVYEQLEKCSAQEKLLIVDVCRFNPLRGLERPGSGPMGTKLDAALKNPPPGVQVWSACVAGQYSYEGPVNLASSVNVIGGFFLTELAEATGAFQRKVNLGTQAPTEPLPLDVLANGDGMEITLGNERVAKGVHSCTAHDAREWYSSAQTPRLSGQSTNSDAAYDPDAPLPARIEIRSPSPPDGGAAERKVVQQILDDTETKMERDGAIALRARALPPFSATKLAEYGDDGEMTPFREEVIRATNLVKKHAKTFKDKFDRSPTADAVKKQILKDQHEPARALAELMGKLDALKEMESDKADEKSKRWRANYDYVVAKLHAHVAYVYEYNFMLGQIRKDALPPRDPKKHTGWRLASVETLQSGPEGKKLAAEAKKRLDAVAKDHAGTPWEILAKRQAVTALGLEWQPCP